MTARCYTTGLARSTAYTKRGCRCDACRAWRREAHHRRYAANPERERERERRWRVANPEKVREKARRYRSANLERERERVRRYRAANLEKVREIQLAYKRRLRAAVVAFLGGACERCGSVQSLDAHHVNGDGDEHRRRASGVRGSWLDILNGAYPREDVQLLCRSCHNLAKRGR